MPTLPTLHVCPLSEIDTTVARTGARTLVTLLRNDYHVSRPACIRPERHYRIPISDIVEPMEGQVVPGRDHVDGFLAFLRGWDRSEPMLIHCFAGVSRSTAAAYIAACALAPQRTEEAIAWTLRKSSPTATPNALLVKHADDLLGRGGRMVASIQAIGRGADCMQGEPFTLSFAGS
jgi:predicted protein tyrosine phosphatase